MNSRVCPQCCCCFCCCMDAPSCLHAPPSSGSSSSSSRSSSSAWLSASICITIAHYHPQRASLCARPLLLQDPPQLQAPSLCCWPLLHPADPLPPPNPFPHASLASADVAPRAQMAGGAWLCARNPDAADGAGDADAAARQQQQQQQQQQQWHGRFDWRHGHHGGCALPAGRCRQQQQQQQQ